MKFTVEREVLDLGLKVIGILITNVDNKTQDEFFLTFKDKAYKALKQKYQDFDIETDMILKGFHELHKKINVKRRKNTPISENILKRFLKEEKMPDTNKLISIYNIVTLDSRLSIGMHDIDKISGNVNLKIAGADEKYTSITGKIKTLNQNQYVYTDKKNIIFKLEVYQNPKTFVTETTKNIFITVQGNEATSAEYLMEVASEIIHLITTYCGGNAQIIYK